MASKTFKVTGTSTTAYDSAAYTKATFVESGTGANIFAIQDDATTAKVTLTGTGDKIYIEGASGEYDVKVSGKTVTLKSATQTITLVLGSVSSTNVVADTLYFLDGSVSLGNSTGSATIKLGGQSLSSKYKAITAELTSSETAIDYFDNPSQTGTTYDLSSSTNTVTGTADNDTFEAADGELNSSDELNGAGGDDVLSATLSNDTVKPTLTGIEIINVASTNAGANTLDLGSSTGVEQVNSVDALSALTVSNVGNVIDSKVVNNTQSLTVNYTAAALAGSADNMTVTLNNHASGTVTIASAATTADLETLTINSIGGTSNAVTLTTGDADVATIVVTGNTAVDVGTLNSDVTTLNASAGAGVTATLAAAATVTGGSGADDVTLASGNNNVSAGGGNDTIRFGTDALGSGDTIVGGAGTDTISFANAATTTVAAADLTGISGIEKIATSAASDAAFTISLSDAVMAANGQSLTIEALSVVSNTGITVNAGSLSSSYALTVDLSNATQTINVASAITLGSGNDTVRLDAYDLDTVLTGNISGGAGTDTILVDNDSSTTQITLDAGISLFEKMTFVTADTSYSLKTVDATVASGVTFVVDASTFTTGRLDFDGTAETTGGTFSIVGGSGADSFIGGAGADVLNGGVGSGNDTLTGGSGSDTISGGAGDDYITGGTEYDSLVGGDGNDTFVGVTAYATGTGVDTIVGGAGTDTISFANAATTTVAAADLTGISGIEKIATSAASDAAFTISLSDAVMAANGQSLTIEALSVVSNTGITVNAGSLSSSYALTVDLSNATQTINVASAITLGSGNDTVRLDAYDLDTVLTGNISGGAGTDTILVDNDSSTTQITLDAGISLFEKMTFVTADTSYSLKTVDATVASGVTFVVDASTFTTGRLDFDGTAETTGGTFSIVGGSGADSFIGGAGADVLNGGVGSGNDTLTGGSGSDTISGGAGDDYITGGTEYDSLVGGDGNDTFVGVTAMGVGSTAVDTIIGGAGTDTISFGAETIAAVDLTGISGIEKITTSATTADDFTISLSDAVLAANGQNLTIEALSIISDSAVTVNAGSLSSSYALTVDLSNATQTIDVATSITLGSGNDTVRLDAYDLDTVLTGRISGGAGTDTILVDNDSSTTQITLNAGISLFEKITFVTADTSYSLKTVDATVASGVTFVVDASTFTTGRLDFDGSAETTGGTFSIVGGSGADSFIGGAGADVLTGNVGNDTLTGGSGADTISGGAGNDVITAGAGADRITLGTGNDTVIYNAVSESTGSTYDTITDWLSADDTIRVVASYSDLGAGVTVNANAANSLAYAADKTTAESNLSAARGEWTYDTGASKLYINMNGDNLITTLDYQISVNAATTANSTFANGDLDFYITGTAYADSIVGGAGADSFVGGAGNDTISGGSGADTISGGAGNDSLTGGAGIDTYQDIGSTGNSTAASATTIAGTSLAASDIITFGNGLDIITDFASTDLLDVATAGVAATNLVGNLAKTTAGTDGATYVVYGTYSSGAFTVAATFNATTAKDALVFVGDGTKTLVNTTGYVLLDDLTAALGTANLV